ncbi:MAG: type II toxin-antitoxin system RelE/ParE family toxin [Prosthecobacter sp.]|nr:type II toxin-antitoxin system RelE/ParE family toxin [Prosthecobacter sp.]
MTELVWTLGAEADVQSLYERLEDWEEGSGDHFYAEVLSAVAILQAWPKIGPIVHGGKVRRVLVFNRNYGVFYVVEDRGIILHALLDLRQDPDEIRRRLRRV